MRRAGRNTRIWHRTRKPLAERVWRGRGIEGTRNDFAEATQSDLTSVRPAGRLPVTERTSPL
jgi:hypothetical protein